ncbi:hypothetical protein CQ007_12445 [Pseudomonas sp. MYb185]|nr:hypothetical protein CQ007_12445 [Pseudomonas sp. MYb185]
MASFDSLVSRMDAKLMAGLNDGRVDYFTASGQPLAAGIEAIVEREVERVNDVTGAIDRLITICVLKSQLGQIARQGIFRSNADAPVAALAGRDWIVDGIESDDGSLITFYVVP